MNTSRTVTFILSNPNPIDIKIEKFYFTLPYTNIQLDYMRLIEGDQAKIISKTNSIAQVSLNYNE